MKRSCTIRWGITGLCLAATLALAGCTYDDDDDDRYGRYERDQWRDTHYPSRRGEYDRDDLRRDPELARYGNRVPREARILERGRGELSTRVNGRGMVYLYDVNDERVVWSGTVRDGERVTIDPENDRASVDGRLVYDRNLERNHEHRIYFVPVSDRFR